LPCIKNLLADVRRITSIATTTATATLEQISPHKRGWARGYQPSWIFVLRGRASRSSASRRVISFLSDDRTAASNVSDQVSSRSDAFESDQNGQCRGAKTRRARRTNAGAERSVFAPSERLVDMLARPLARARARTLRRICEIRRADGHIMRRVIVGPPIAADCAPEGPLTISN